MNRFLLTSRKSEKGPTEKQKVGVLPALSALLRLSNPLEACVPNQPE